MRELTRSVAVKAPSSFALAFMTSYFMDRGAQRNGAELALRFPLPHFIVDGLTVEKRVMVHLDYASGGSGHPLTIGWQPLGKGPLPGFSGALAASAQTDETCRLSITGTYAPPGGIFGLLFDQLIGVRIAGATISALLEQFKDAIESDYAIRLVP
jgi:hypothetical protein